MGFPDFAGASQSPHKARELLHNDLYIIFILILFVSFGNCLYFRTIHILIVIILSAIHFPLNEVILFIIHETNSMVFIKCNNKEQIIELFDVSN